MPGLGPGPGIGLIFELQLRATMVTEYTLIYYMPPGRRAKHSRASTAAHPSGHQLRNLLSAPRSQLTASE